MGNKKKTRGRLSKIDQLPVAIRYEINKMLRDRHISQADILTEISNILKRKDLPSCFMPSRSGLSLYAKRRIEEQQEEKETRMCSIGEVERVVKELSELKELVKLILERLPA